MNQSGERASRQSGTAPTPSVVPVIAAKEEFDRFYDREHQAILALAYVMTGDRHQAQDLTQDAFVAAFQKWESIDSPRAWIRTVVANRSKSWLRRRYREAKALVRADRPSPGTPVEMGAETAEFWDSVRSLPQRQAQTLALFYLEQHRTPEIAAILGCSESTVRVHLTRGRRALATRLGVEP